MDREALEQLSKDQLIELVLSLLQRVADLEARIAGLSRPPKTPDNSSTPPSQGRRPNAMRPSKAERRRKGRPGVARGLHPDPDRVVDAVVETCPNCRAVMPVWAQTPQAVYDRIEIPPIVPEVTRVRLFGGRCACCGARVVASAPAGLEPGSPFGKSIAALVVYLHYAHAIGLARLKVLMGEVFGLTISEGGRCNLLARAGQPLATEATAIAERVTAARVVCSDETSARVKGRNQWEWVFVTAQAVLHMIRPSRGKAVPRELFGAIRPGVWVSDMLASQRGHAEEWQVCLAHLLRDAQYVIDCGDNAFGTAFKRLLLRAIAIGRRREELKDTTLRQYQADLDRRLDRILAILPATKAGKTLRKRLVKDRAHLFVFVTDREVPYTNNVSERNLRPSVVFRKVTNGFRSHWGAESYAAFRSVVSTAKANGRSCFGDLRGTLAAQPLLTSSRVPG
jgi:transposase